MDDDKLDNLIRQSWKEGSKCEIYSNSKKKWFGGEVVQIFHDEEGEWLEIRYDKSMSKQVQRYSTDIRSLPGQTYEMLKNNGSPKKSQKKQPQQQHQQQQQQQSHHDYPFDPEIMKIRTSWAKGCQVEIFSNTHQEWYIGEVVDIIKDEEGEWLNVVWQRANGEAMSKQVQRFSTDVRPPQTRDGKLKHNNNNGNGNNNNNNNNNNTQSNGSLSNDSSNDSASAAAKRIKQHSDQIQSRKSNFRRRAPPFSRTLRASTFTYPATAAVRRQRKLVDLEEKEEKDEVLHDSTSTHTNQKKKNIKSKKKLKFSTMRPPQVREFIRSLGKEYNKYANKFQNISGKEFITLEENVLAKKYGMPKLHRWKVLLEIARNKPGNDIEQIMRQAPKVDVLNWTANDVKKWASKHSSIVSKYATNFEHNGVDGLLLFDLDPEDLSLIGVIKQSHQKKVLDAIQKLRETHFPPEKNDLFDAKDEEMNNNNNDNNVPLSRRRQSVQMNENVINRLKREMSIDTEARDDLLLAMAQLLMELGQLFNAPKIQSLTNTLNEKLKIYVNSIQMNENHDSNDNLFEDDDNMNNDELMNNHLNNNRANPNLFRKINESDQQSPTGMGFASNWLKTLNNTSGHRRRRSLPHINTNQLPVDEEEEEDVSDLEVD